MSHGHPVGGFLVQTRLLIGITLSLAVLAGGTLGYYWLEGWDLFDSLYMTIITVTTVGFGEVRPLSPEGRTFTMVLLLVGVGIILYLMTTMTQMVVEGKIREALGRRSVQKHIRSMRGHFIVCGYGRIGSQVAQMLRENGVKTVIVDSSDRIRDRLTEANQEFIFGSATEDECLMAAGIDRARGLVASVSSDADNVFITLTAKGMNPNLMVIARATEPGSELKLKRAGADKVVSPYFIGARRIAQMVIRPTVADFVDLTFHTSDMALRMEELTVGPKAELVGVTLMDSGIRKNLDVIVLAIKKPGGGMVFNPPASTVVEVGDTLVTMGPRQSMNRLGQMADAVED
ncbi:TrkA-N domain protein [Desulfarculus baarsii DSM 2075]|uniref:TrkA-N domain protein n=1 Tax=Desulfarculus baarsii (strain ATCC 33931 / DSM 2075 / LMG 7858 / VKM B-1802 / 2st14) TaxID=644282 RepID=E1QIM9_DESB2|nr:TrkA-N domain protein [Desulfarculus baarsii DSM 2075]